MQTLFSENERACTTLIILENCIAPWYLPKVFFSKGVTIFFLIKTLHESTWEVLDHFKTKATVCTSPTLDYLKFHFLVPRDYLYNGLVQLWRRSVVLQFKDAHFLYFTLFKCHHQHHKTVISKYSCCTTATLFLKSWLNNTIFRILLELTLTLIILYMWLVVELAIKIDKSMYTWLCLCIVLDNAKSRCERIKENYAITMMSGY